jgi:hypothetical protein
MTTTYHILARCLRPFLAWIDIEAETPEAAIAKVDRQDSGLIASAQDSESWPWDEFTAYDRDGKELLHALDPDARLRETAPALLEALLAVLPYARAEAEGLEGYRGEDEVADQQADDAWKAVEQADTLLATIPPAGRRPS